ADVPRLLRMALGTDPGGVGLGHTQRLPGTWNVKAEHRREDGTYPEVTLTDDEDRLWAGERRTVAALRAAVEEHYPAALEVAAAGGLAGDRRIAKADLDAALAAEVEFDPVPRPLRLLLEPAADEDVSRARYQFIVAALEAALPLRQIVEAVAGSALASTKTAEQIEDDLARIAGKKSGRHPVS